MHKVNENLPFRQGDFSAISLPQIMNYVHKVPEKITGKIRV